LPPGLNLVVGVVGRSGPSALGPDVDVWLDGTSPARQVRAVETLWTDRLLPLEANLRLGRRARRRMGAVLVDPDPTWPDQAARLIGRLDHAIGRSAIRVDHIGSTSIPGLPAKDLVDIQVTVTDLSTARDAAERARTAGFVLVAGEWSGLTATAASTPSTLSSTPTPAAP
jgi:dephospho-CoA kinase